MQALHALMVLDTPAEERFDRVVQMAVLAALRTLVNEALAGDDPDLGDGT